MAEHSLLIQTRALAAGITAPAEVGLSAGSVEVADNLVSGNPGTSLVGQADFTAK